MGGEDREPRRIGGGTGGGVWEAGDERVRGGSSKRLGSRRNRGKLCTMLNILQSKKGLKGGSQEKQAWEPGMQAMGGMMFGQPWPHLQTIAFYPKNKEVRIIFSAL